MSTHVSTQRSARGALPDTVSVGLLTQTGLGTTLLMFLSALIDMIVGDHFDSDTKFLIATGAATAIATILARAYQQGKLWIAKRFNVDLPDQPLR